MRILLFGASGQLGWELQRALAPLGEIVAPGRRGTPGLVADFAEPASLAAVVEAVAPDLIVNAAAHTAVDRAEAEPELAQAVNARAPGVLARAAAARGARLIHYSTDYVFDGSGEQPRDEDAPAAPLSVYGRTKLDGEQEIRASGCAHLLLRTSWVYAARGANFATTMLRLAAERSVLKVVDDQIGAPTGAELLADLTAQMLPAWRARPELAGTYHAVAAGHTSWHGYAAFVLDAARARGLALALPAEGLQAVPSSGYVTAATRPLNSRLDTRKLRVRFGLVLPDWQRGVARMLEEILPPPAARRP